MNELQKITKKNLKDMSEIELAIWYTARGTRAFDMEAAAVKLAALKAELRAWKNFATHQMGCGVCADNCYDCSTGMELMTAALKGETK